MPDPQKLLSIVRRATTLFRATPGRVGSIVGLDLAADVLVVGDLHGHLHTFKAALALAALDKNPNRHLVLQELVHDPRIDPDEGQVDPSHKLVDVVCVLKCQYPDRVHVILGNHELSELTGRSISKNGHALNALFRSGVEASYGAAAGEIIAAYYELFRALPLACRTPNRVFLCHTIPDERDLENLDLELLKTGVWTEESMARRGTVYAMTWGRDTSPETADRFAAIVDADLFVCGHQPCDEGYQVANPRTLILDGTDPLPAFCLFDAQGSMTIEGLQAGVKLIGVGGD